MKACSTCKIEKPLSEFSPAKRYKDGYRGQCKTCCLNYKTAWRSANLEKVRAATYKWREANAEKHKAQRKAWLESNREKHRASGASWRENNRDKSRANARAWRIANPDKDKARRNKHRTENLDKYRIYAHNRRARERVSGGKLSTDLEAKLFALQKGRCACCNQPLGDKYHLDHIVPIALGGENEDWNIQLLRASCNSQKHTKHPVEFMQERGFLL